MARRSRPLTPVLVNLRVVLLGLVLGVAGWIVSGVTLRVGPGWAVRSCSVGSCAGSSGSSFWTVQPGVLVMLVGLILIIFEVYSGTGGRRAIAPGQPA